MRNQWLIPLHSWILKTHHQDEIKVIVFFFVDRLFCPLRTPHPKKTRREQVNLLLSHGCCVISISVKRPSRFALRAYLPHEENQNGFTVKPPTQCLAVIFFLIIILCDCFFFCPKASRTPRRKGKDMLVKCFYQVFGIIALCLWGHSGHR